MTHRPGRNLLLLRALGLAVLLGSLAPQTVEAVAIGDLHCNDTSGRPRAPYTIGTSVTVSGTVAAGTGTFSSTFTEVYLQDPTGGIQIYNPAVPTTFVYGDSFTVSGTIQQYRGNTEVQMTTATRIGSAHPVPEPRVLTCYQIEHSYGVDNCEPNESRLVRVNNVTYSGTWPSYSGAVTLSDSTGTCTMYIDGDTGVQGVPPPGGRFDAIGILKQYSGFSPPFNSGYELLPRRPEDILAHPGPQILTGPVETDIQDRQVSIAWTTDLPASSRVDYGLTSSYELGFISDPALVTEHSMVLSDLTPATIYHYRVETGNEDGTTQSGDRLFCSGSGSEATGRINVYFNKSVDPSLSLGYPAEGNVNFITKLLDRISTANYSIDICLYSFDVPGLADALISAKNRGVLIRFVYDNRTPYQSQVTRLIQNGITVIDDAFGNNPGTEIMHNKFWVFDHRGGSPDESDDWIWTGSYNVTNEGTFTDSQNVIEIQDAALATVYTAEFEEMWGSSTQTPNPATSRFGVNKMDDTPKRFNVRGVPMQLYFSPSDGVIQAAIQRVLEADASIHFCINSFTRYDLAVEMQNKYYDVPGFELHGVFDSSEGGSQSSQYQDMKGIGSYPWDPPADVWLDMEAGTLHHKYMIVDVNKADLAPTVITGSANWSTNANDENDENMLIVQDFGVANQYYQEFAGRYTAAGGTAYLAGGIGPASAPPRQTAPALRAWPNPVVRELSLTYSLPQASWGILALYSPDGRQERVLYRGALEAGTRRMVFHLGSSGRSTLASGIHFVRLETGDRRLISRVLVLH